MLSGALAGGTGTGVPIGVGSATGRAAAGPRMRSIADASGAGAGGSLRMKGNSIGGSGGSVISQYAARSGLYGCHTVDRRNPAIPLIHHTSGQRPTSYDEATGDAMKDHIALVQTEVQERLRSVLVQDEDRRLLRLSCFTGRIG